MFEIRLEENGPVLLSGRFDASRTEEAQAVLDSLTSSTVVDMSGLDYISSAGLAVLLRTQKRLMSSGSGLKFIHVSHHIFDIFRYSGFDQVFDIVPAEEK